MNIKNTIRGAINGLGFDLVRLSGSPNRTLLGLSKQNIGTVIDVGANKGQFALSIAEFFPQATFYCFEPLEGPFQELSDWALSKPEQVHCFQLALGDREGSVEMHLHEQHTPSSSLLASTDIGRELYPQTRAERLTTVRLSTLDSVLEGVLDSMPREILLKLDVQGFEDRVLLGANRVLPQCRAVILEVCIGSLYEGQADFHRLTQMLGSGGFRYAGNLNQAYHDDGRVLFLDAVFVK